MQPTARRSIEGVVIDLTMAVTARVVVLKQVFCCNCYSLYDIYFDACVFIVQAIPAQSYTKTTTTLVPSFFPLLPG